MPPLKIYVGWDRTEHQAYSVAVTSMRRRAAGPLEIHRLSLTALQANGLYRRPTKDLGKGQLWDVISEAPMSTGHAIGRFFVPYLCGFKGWALFTDGDVLVRADIAELFALADQRYAVMVVQHEPMPEQAIKKTGQAQTQYGRKNWSSVMLFNCEHESNRQLMPSGILSKWPGRDLHAFKWLTDDEVGALPQGWNYLVNVTQPIPERVCLAHYTLGAPNLPFAEEWWESSADAKGAGLLDEVPA